MVPHGPQAVLYTPQQINQSPPLSSAFNHCQFHLLPLMLDIFISIPFYSLPLKILGISFSLPIFPQFLTFNPPQHFHPLHNAPEVEFSSWKRDIIWHSQKFGLFLLFLFYVSVCGIPHPFKRSPLFSQVLTLSAPRVILCVRWFVTRRFRCHHWSPPFSLSLWFLFLFFHFFLSNTSSIFFIIQY